MHQSDLDILESQYANLEVIDITSYMWSFIDVMVDRPYCEIMNMPIYQKICNILNNNGFGYGCLKVHECVLEGPNYTKTRRFEEPHLVYYFTDLLDIICWLYYRGPMDYKESLSKMYSYLERNLSHTY